MAIAPAKAYPALLEEAPPVARRGAEVVDEIEVDGVGVGGAAVTVDSVITGMVVYNVLPLLVAVSSEGTVTISVTGTEVPRVIGI
jgi:hypothetical protein